MQVSAQSLEGCHTMNSSTQFDYDEIKKAWHNYCNEDLETFHYGFYVELQKMNNEKDTTNE